MPVTWDHERLRALAAAVIRAGGSEAAEAACVADHLVDANLAGHDSHGVGMLPAYVRNLADGTLRPNQAPEVVQRHGSFAVWDGRGGYGQVIARDAMTWCIETARRHGIAVHGLRNTHHIGRVGAYGELAARAGLVSIQFVNGHSGTPPRVSPFRGRAGRFSTNPICIAIPGTNRAEPFVLDFATSRIALGKVRVAYNEGRPIAPGTLVAADGTPTNDPAVIYTEPHGALLPFGEHKGYGLAMVCELLAGAVAGAGVIRSDDPPKMGITNGVLSFVLDPGRLNAGPMVAAEIDALVDWVKSTPPADPALPVLVAGEPERIAREARLRDGIVIDDTTWTQIRRAAATLGVQIEAA